MKEHRNSPRPWLICLALAGITLAVFSPVFHYDFINYDDQVYVTENPYVLSGINLNSLAWAFQTSSSGNWIPLTWISHMLDVLFYGAQAGGHHFTSVLFHAANVVLLFLLLQKMTGATWRSACVAAFFGWHPAHVESVAWIAERKDVLSTFFALLTLLAYVRYAREFKIPGAKRAFFYLSASLLFALGLMAKPMLVTLPFAMLLLDFWPLGRMTRRSWPRLLIEKIPWFALSAACCAVTIWAQHKQNAIASVAKLSLGRRAGHALASYLNYLVMLIFPRGLAIFYPYPRHETAMVITGSVVIALLFAVVIAGARRRPWLAVGWLWFVGWLVPVIGLVQVGDQAIADRYTYLPSVGLFIMAVWAGAELVARFPFIKMLAPAAGLAMLAATWTQIHYWKDTRSVFEHARQVTENNYLAVALLGTVSESDGNLDKAIEFYQESLREYPNYGPAHFFLGRSLEQQGKIEQAEAEYRRAIRLKPWFEQAHISLGLLLFKKQQYDEAGAEYETVLKINPRSPAAHNDLGHLLQTEGRLDESIQHYLDAIKYDSSLAQAHNNLGALYSQKGQWADAILQLREASRLNPGNIETKFNLALALNQQQQWNEAAALWRQVAPALANNANAQYQYGLALAHEGQTRQAMGQYAHAILLTPDFAEALEALAWIAATDPQPELRNGAQAVGLASRACNLTGRKQPGALLALAAAYAETGRFNEARATLQDATRLLDSQPDKQLKSRAARVGDAIRKSRPFHTAARIGVTGED